MKKPSGWIVPPDYAAMLLRVLIAIAVLGFAAVATRGVHSGLDAIGAHLLDLIHIR